ncbi:hypothetical protein BSLA_02r1598 [Burkholderia stabilis]|nr:hypothetical protein BSLA_02r1598 [Burkholderia stabilis]
MVHDGLSCCAYPRLTQARREIRRADGEYFLDRGSEERESRWR